MQPPPPDPQPPAAIGVQPGTYEVDESVWRAITGAGVEIAGEKSYVYYFPNGHLEQLDATSLAKRHNFPNMPAKILCEVTSVHFHSDPVSEQPFAVYFLQPTKNKAVIGGGKGGGGGADDDLLSFEKVVVQSEAYNSGGSALSLPKPDAEAIFPNLDKRNVPAAQTLTLTDTLNVNWRFQHIYRNRHHLLTAGWPRYRDLRKPYADDSVVFMKRKSTNTLLIGLRRLKKFSGSGEGYGGKEVAKEIEKAVRGLAFKVLYYPKKGVANFVVLADKVEKSLEIQWKAGLRVRMLDDSTFPCIVDDDLPASGPWMGSPWKVLAINLDGTGITRNVIHMSPWEVKIEDTQQDIPVPPADFRASKRPRLHNDDGMTTDDVLVNDPSVSSPSIPAIVLSESSPCPMSDLLAEFPTTYGPKSPPPLSPTDFLDLPISFPEDEHLPGEGDDPNKGN